MITTDLLFYVTRYFFLTIDKLISGFIWNKKTEYIKIGYRDISSMEDFPFLVFNIIKGWPT